MERPYDIGLTKAIYNNNCVSKNAKISHCSTVVKPERLHASGWLALNSNLGKLEILERQIIKKRLGARKCLVRWILRSNDEVCQNI